MHLSVLAEILDSLRDKRMLQELSPLKREEIVIFICEQYTDYVEDDYRDELEDFRSVLDRIHRELSSLGY